MLLKRIKVVNKIKNEIGNILHIDKSVRISHEAVQIIKVLSGLRAQGMEHKAWSTRSEGPGIGRVQSKVMNKKLPINDYTIFFLNRLTDSTRLAHSLSSCLRYSRPASVII